MDGHAYYVEFASKIKILYDYLTQAFWAEFSPEFQTDAFQLPKNSTIWASLDILNSYGYQLYSLEIQNTHSLV